jgi:hypothetical protein
MEIFINELSLEGQFFTDEEFAESVRIFTAIFSLIDKIKEKQMYRDSLFLNRQAIKNDDFRASLQRVKNKNLKQAFQQIIFNKLNPKDWRTQQKHSINDLFAYKNEDVTNTSLAELSERKIQNRILLGLLVNFTKSRFTNEPIAIIKNFDETNPVELDCVNDKFSLKIWLDDNLQLSLIEYDVTSKTPPTDKQTVLRDENRFEPLSISVQGRRVYREMQTGYYWYVDNLHVGQAAHLEVFNTQGEHLGEADLDGTLNRSKKDSTKQIDIS